MNRYELLTKVRSGIKVFNNEDIEGNFIHDELTSLTFNKCYIAGDFSGSNLTSTTFIECNLKTCKFKYANINNASFLYNCMESVDFSFTHYDDLIFKDNSAYSSPLNLDNIHYIKSNEIIGFNIYNVNHGWFGLSIYYRGERLNVEASGFLGYDGPKDLIKAFIYIYKSNGSVTERWICWHDEPGALIWRLSKSEQDICIQIYYSIEDSDKLMFVGDAYLQNNAGEINLDIIVNGNIAMSELVDAFYRIRDKMGYEKYAKEWFSFPDEELKALKLISMNK